MNQKITIEKEEKNMKYHRYDILEVEWLDAHSSQGWFLPSELKDWIENAEYKYLIKTIGYYISEDEFFLRLGMGYDNQGRNQTNGEDNINQPYAIVKKGIHDIRLIKKFKIA